MKQWDWWLRWEQFKCYFRTHQTSFLSCLSASKSFFVLSAQRAGCTQGPWGCLIDHTLKNLWKSVEYLKSPWILSLVLEKYLKMNTCTCNCIPCLSLCPSPTSPRAMNSKLLRVHVVLVPPPKYWVSVPKHSSAVSRLVLVQKPSWPWSHCHKPPAAPMKAWPMCQLWPRI